VAQALGWPLDPRALRRVKDTTPLVGLREAERVAAVADAFAATRSLESAHVLLVDDVATTCSTLAAASRACLAASAASVAAITLAREPKREPSPARARNARPERRRLPPARQSRHH
jgi:predicted amidophosphoribosyltransferase